MSHANRKPGNAFSIIALALSVAACGISLYTLATNARTNAATGDYERVVQELWSTFEPVYIEFGMELPSTQPTTIAEALEPLVRVPTTLVAPSEPDRQ